MGRELGTSVGSTVGEYVGRKVGCRVGAFEGFNDTDGLTVGVIADIYTKYKFLIITR